MTRIGNYWVCPKCHGAGWLPPNYVVDYLIAGKNSGGFEFIFIELEPPVDQITIGKAEFGVVIRAGINQVDDWDLWLD